MKNISKFLYLIAVLSLVSFFVVWVILKAFAPFMWVALALTVLCLGLGIFFDRAILFEFFSAKTTKSGMSMGVMILLALVLLVTVNFLGARKYKTFDFSSAGLNSLSEQSAQVVRDLKGELKVYYFYKESENTERNKAAFLELLRKYQDLSSQIKLEFVDMNARPDLTNQFGVASGVETVWVQYGDKKSKMEKIDEQELTSSIIKATREKEKVVYFTTGHGELGFESSPDGLSMTALKQLLEGNRYSVRTLSFMSTLQIPRDADVVWILGPRQVFIEAEIKSLEEYLARGGQMILSLNPKEPHGLSPFLQKAGVKLANNFIVTAIDLGGQTAIDPRAVRGNVFGSTPITKPFGQGQSTVFALPQALLRIQPSPSGISIEDVLKTTGQAMAFEDSRVFSSSAGLKGGERGPFSLGQSIRGKWNKEGGVLSDKEFGMVVYGSATAFSDALLYGSLNRDLALNTVSMLAKEETLISITPKDVTRTNLNLTRTQIAMFLFGLILPLPLLMFFLSGFVWWRRRSA